MQRQPLVANCLSPCEHVQDRDVPLIVQKSDGGFGYASTDMAALNQRLHEEKADWIVYITDVGQANHFAMARGIAGEGWGELVLGGGPPPSRSPGWGWAGAWRPRASDDAVPGLELSCRGFGMHGAGV